MRSSLLAALAITMAAAPSAIAQTETRGPVRPLTPAPSGEMAPRAPQVCCGIPHRGPRRDWRPGGLRWTYEFREVTACPLLDGEPRIVAATMCTGVRHTPYRPNDIAARPEPEPVPMVPRLPCEMFAHRDFRGWPPIYLADGEYASLPNLSAWTNDIVSSVRVENGCRLQAWIHDDRRGDTRFFGPGDHPYVGDGWNDQISSAECTCEAW